MHSTEHRDTAVTAWGSEELTAKQNSLLAREIGFVLVGHGTRQIAGQQQLRQVFNDFARIVAPIPAELAFLELAEPDIEKSVRMLAERGVKRLVSVPVLLFSAGHAERDIPDAVAAAAKKHGLEAAGQTQPLQNCPAIIELSAIRFREAVCELASKTDCAQGCSGRWCPDIGLLMIGRGSSSFTATEAMQTFTAQRRQLTPTAWSLTAFIHAQAPSVDEGLNQLAESGCRLAVVQPHLLFEGELVESLRRQVTEQGRKHCNQRWIISSTLGADRRLAKTLGELAICRALDLFSKQVSS